MVSAQFFPTIKLEEKNEKLLPPHCLLLALNVLLGSSEVELAALWDLCFTFRERLCLVNASSPEETAE